MQVEAPSDEAPSDEAYFPASQSTQAEESDEAVLEFDLPAAQTVHCELSSRSLYFPVGQISHAPPTATTPSPRGQVKEEVQAT